MRNISANLFLHADAEGNPVWLSRDNLGLGVSIIITKEFGARSMIWLYVEWLVPFSGDETGELTP